MGPAGSRSSQCNPLPSSTQGNHSSIEAQPAAARPQLPLFLPADLACSGCSTMGVESAQPTPAAAAEQAQDVIDAARYDELEDVVAHLSAEVSLDSADFARPNGADRGVIILLGACISLLHIRSQRRPSTPKLAHNCLRHISPNI